MAPKRKQQSIVKMFAKKAAKDAAAATELLADSPPTSSRRVAKKNETIEITDDNDTDVVQKSNKVESPSLTTSMVNPPTVGVSMWLGQKKHYDVYDKESPIEGRLEQDGPRNTRRNTRQRNKPVSRYSADEPAAQATNAPDTLSSDDESDKEPAEFQHFLAQVEKNAVTLIDHLERFVTRDVGLGRLEQGMLMHIVLNADNHSTDGPGGVLSPKAFSLLMLNARLHPPCKVEKIGDNSVLEVNKGLWMPEEDHKIEGFLPPQPLLENRKHQRLIFLGSVLYQQATLLHKQICSSALTISGSAVEEHKAINKSCKSWEGSSVLGGGSILFAYYLQLIEVDMDMRMEVVRSWRTKAESSVLKEILLDSTLGKMMSCHGPTSSQLWGGEFKTAKSLVKHMATVVLMAAFDKALMSVEEEEALASGGGPASAAEKDSAEPPASSSDGPGAAATGPPRPPVIDLGELGSLARKLLCLMYDFYMRLEELECSHREGDKSTDLCALSDHLLSLMMDNGSSKGSGLDNCKVDALGAYLKDPEKKLVLLSCFSPRAQLHLLTRAAEKNAKNLVLEGVFQAAREYDIKKGLKGTAPLKIAPVELLELLSTDALYDRASLFSDKGTASRSGFALWLAAFATAACSASAAEGAELCDIKQLHAAFEKLRIRWSKNPSDETVATSMFLSMAHKALAPSVTV